MSRLDLKSDFWQIPLDKDSRKYTTFLYKNKSYQFKAVPFGLVTSLTPMIGCIQLALCPEVEDYVSVFLDDIFVTSKSFEEYMQYLHAAFENRN